MDWENSVKEYNPKTGEGVVALSSDTLGLRTDNFSFNIKDPICFLKTQVTQGMKVNLDVNDRGILKGIYTS